MTGKGDPCLSMDRVISKNTVPGYIGSAKQIHGDKTMTTENSDVLKSFSLAYSILADMNKAKVYATPNNYRLWFEHNSGQNKALTDELGRLVQSGNELTEDVTTQLYKKYFGKSKEITLMKKVHHETQKIIKTIFEEIITTSNSTSDYGKRLEDYTTKLNNADQISQVQDVVKGIVKETKQMAESNRQMNEKLREATESTKVLKLQLEKTEKEAMIDDLTGLYNRKAFDKRIQELFSEYKEKGTPFTVVMLDIDFFKKFNDTYGHQVGDEVLSYVGATLHKLLQGGDYPARYGGEEFVILLPATELKNAGVVAEKLRFYISVKQFNEKIDKKITASLGVAMIQSEDSIESIVARADKALYLAKESGRNNVKTETDLPKN